MILHVCISTCDAMFDDCPRLTSMLDFNLDATGGAKYCVGLGSLCETVAMERCCQGGRLGTDCRPVMSDEASALHIQIHTPISNRTLVQ